MTALLVAALAATVATASAAYDPVQRQALEDLYKSTHGDSWRNNTRWLQGDNYCEWHGIQCSVPQNNVEVVALKDNNLVGTIPASITDLVYLKLIDLSSNLIGGEIPHNLASLQTLQHLSLNDNELTGPFPAAIANDTYPWPTLQYIFLQNNKLTGSVPNTFFGPENLPPFHPNLNLKTLNVMYNQMSGPIPDRVTRATLMQALLLEGNAFTGAIPASMSTFLNTLKYCQIGVNQWSCPIPSDIQEHCQVWKCVNGTAVPSQPPAAVAVA